ncbi:MAG: V-type ATPase 116kDa subunit family protein [bacterium]|nr:V-type ATPase 116kDa subunit family protein [bacterium]
MSYIEIVGIKKHLSSIVEKLHSFGKMQIEKIPITEDFGEVFLHKVHLQEKEVLEEQKREELSEVLEEIINHIPKYILNQLREDIALNTEKTVRKRQALEKKGTEGYSYVAMIQRQIRSFIRRRNNIENDIQLLSNYKKVVAIFKEIVPQYGWREKYDIIGITIDKSNKYVLPIIQEEFFKVTNNDYKFISKNLDEKRLIAVIGFKKKHLEKIKNFIWNEKIDELRIPGEYRGKPLDESLSIIEEKLKQLPLELKEVSKKIDILFQEDGLNILLLNMMNKDCLNRIKAYSSFAQSQYTFVIKGWIPSEDIERLKGELKDNYKDSVVINELHLRKGDYSKVPILLSNPKKRRPFERLLAFLSLPKYGTLDATSLIAVFFPMFFGLILADIGYGILLILISRLLSYYAKGRNLLKDISWIFLISAISTIIFGTIFGEFFGDIGKRFGLHPIWLKREEAIMPLLVLAIVVGVVHIMIGLVLGTINSYLTNRKYDMWNTAVRLLILIGIIFIGSEVGNFLPPIFFNIGMGMLLIFIPVSIKLHGFMAPLEVISTMGNILSYARIMAIGVASVILAMVANKLGSSFNSLLLGVIVATLFHVLNLAVGIFSTTIHSLRLHYVEFFSKFYITGGREYKPFRKSFL